MASDLAQATHNARNLLKRTAEFWQMFGIPEAQRMGKDISLVLAALEVAETRCAELTEAAGDVLAAFSRMPDAGFTNTDPRWAWWHETAGARDALRAVLAASEPPRADTGEAAP